MPLDVSTATFAEARAEADNNHFQAQQKLREITGRFAPESVRGQQRIKEYVDSLRVVRLVDDREDKVLRAIWKSVPPEEFEKTSFEQAVEKFLASRKDKTVRDAFSQASVEVTREGLDQFIAKIDAKLTKYHALLENFYRYTPDECDTFSVFRNTPLKENFAPEGKSGPKSDNSVFLMDKVGNAVAGIDFVAQAHNAKGPRSTADMPTVQTNFPIVPIPFHGTALGKAVLDRLENERDSLALKFFQSVRPAALAKHGRFALFVETDHIPTLTVSDYKANLDRSGGKPEWEQWEPQKYGRVAFNHRWPTLEGSDESVKYHMHVAERVLAGNSGAFRLGNIQRINEISPATVLNHYRVAFLSSKDGGEDSVAQNEFARLEKLVAAGKMLKIYTPEQQARYIEAWTKHFNAIEAASPTAKHDEDVTMKALGTYLPTASKVATVTRALGRELTASAPASPAPEVNAGGSALPASRTYSISPSGPAREPSAEALANPPLPVVTSDEEYNRKIRQAIQEHANAHLAGQSHIHTAHFIPVVHHWVATGAQNIEHKKDRMTVNYENGSKVEVETNGTKFVNGFDAQKIRAAMLQTKEAHGDEIRINGSANPQFKTMVMAIAQIEGVTVANADNSRQSRAAVALAVARLKPQFIQQDAANMVPDAAGSPRNSGPPRGPGNRR